MIVGMRHKIYFFLACVLPFAFMSCDTREDIFKEDYNNMIFVVKFSDGSRDTLTKSINNPRATFDFYPEQEKRADWGLGYESLKLEYITVYGDGHESNLRSLFVSIDEYGVDSVRIEKHGDEVQIFYEQRSMMSYLGDCLSMRRITSDEGLNRMFVNDTTPALLYSGILRVAVDDMLGKPGDCIYYYAKMNIWGTCPPVPVLEVKDVEGKPMTKTLSLASSYDRDGNVWKYEYCIDGNVLTYDEKDNHLEFIEGVWQGGNAAFGGTYITATELNEIRHAFQTEGEHTIHYRCMDNNGAWSTWREEKVLVTK